MKASEVSAQDIPVLIDTDTLHERVRELAADINSDYRGSHLTVVPVLNGSFIFAADLVRHLDVSVRVDFMGLASYGSNTESSGVVKITHDLAASIESEHVLVLEDIVDTGLTIDYLWRNLTTRRPASLRLASLLRKPDRQQIETSVDYLGFDITNHFVVGYGLDWDGHFRELPYLGFIPDELTSS